jgi:hypothetical protein
LPRFTPRWGTSIRRFHWLELAFTDRSQLK